MPGGDASIRATGLDQSHRMRSLICRATKRTRSCASSLQRERADTFPLVVDLRGLEQFQKLFGLLEKRGYTTGRIEKIMGANFLRHARCVWGA
jgi:membrane dipeptidase